MKTFFIRILLAAGIAAAGAYGALSFASSPVRDHPFFSALPQDRPVVIAHRGGALLWPENTMEAFRGALALGSDVLEMDIHRTAEGIPVVIHDETVERTTSGSGRVGDYTADELKDLDAGYRFSPLDAPDTFPLRGQGIGVPLLRDVFEAFPGVPMIVEIKPNDLELADRVVAMVQEFNRADLTLLGSFHHEVLVRVRQSDARPATHLSDNEGIRFLIASWFFSGHLFTPPAEALLVPPRMGVLPVPTRRLISAAERRNLFVAAWTINDADEMRKLLERGIHGLVTDRPDLAVSAVTDARYDGR